MKTKLIPLLTLALILMSGCSLDSEETRVDLGQSESEITKKNQSVSFEFLEYGEFEMTKPGVCGALERLEMAGEMKSEKLEAEFKSVISMCTDFATNNKLVGSYMNEAGEELFFTVTKSGTDDKGNWYIYVFYSGTGQYAKAEGKAQVYTSMEFTTDSKGLFKSIGSGFIKY